jgi:hypothetical protein
MRSPRRMMCAAVLGFECVVLALVTPVLIAVNDLATPLALAIGLGLAGACLVIAGLLRFEWAYYAGFALQLAALAVGLLVPAMVVLAVVFGGLWTAAYVLGRRIEVQQAAWPAEPPEPVEPPS